MEHGSMDLPNMWSYCVVVWRVSKPSGNWSAALHFSHYHTVSLLCTWLLHTTHVFVTHSALLQNSAVTVLTTQSWGPNHSRQLSMTPKIVHYMHTHHFFRITGKPEFGVNCSSGHKIFPYRYRMPEWREKVPTTHTADTNVLADHIRLQCGAIRISWDTMFPLWLHNVQMTRKYAHYIYRSYNCSFRPLKG